MTTKDDIDTSDGENNTIPMSTITSSSNASSYGPFSHEYFDHMTAEELRNYVYQHQLPGEPSSVAAVSIMSLAILVFLCSSLVLLATRYTSGGQSATLVFLRSLLLSDILMSVYSLGRMTMFAQTAPLAVYLCNPSSKYTSGGQSATLVFLRSLLLSDILMSVYGLGKMTMLLKLRHLQINFFLPESFFFTASLASTASLLSLNLDCFLKLTRPLKYAQVDKHTVITVMLFIWNAAFVVGFLPLVGWYQEPYTVRFFSFFPWHFLLFNALVVLLCALVCVGCMVSLKRFHAAIPDPDPACFGNRSLEVRKYRHLHHTILMESCMWLAAYLPFFLYISVTCRQCPAGDFRYSDASIIYFIPVFLVKSLVSAGLQAFRTFHVHAIMNKLITDISNIASPPHRNRSREKGKNVATIFYTNPLCENRDHEEDRLRYLQENKLADSSSSDDGFINDKDGHHHHHHHHEQQRKGRRQGRSPVHHQSRTLLLDHDEWLQHQQALQDTELTDFTSMSEQDNFSRHGSASTITGITNLAFRPSLHLDTEGSTKL